MNKYSNRVPTKIETLKNKANKTVNDKYSPSENSSKNTWLLKENSLKWTLFSSVSSVAVSESFRTNWSSLPNAHMSSVSSGADIMCSLTGWSFDCWCRTLEETCLVESSKESDMDKAVSCSTIEILDVDKQKNWQALIIGELRTQQSNNYKRSANISDDRDAWTE